MTGTKTSISPLEIEAVVFGLKAVSEVGIDRHRDACLRAIRLIRAMAERLKAQAPNRDREIAELARGIQIAHAAWVEMGAPGAWEHES